MNVNEIATIELRNLQMEDYRDLKISMQKAYKDLENSHWHEHHIQKLLNIFPDGQLCIVYEGNVVGVALSLIIDYKKLGDKHNYAQITSNFTFSTHDSEGDILYGIDIFIHPEYRGLRLGRRLYDARKELCENLNLRAILFGGRIPNYNQYAAELKPKEYIQKVRQKEIHDPVLNFQISNDFHVRKILTNYLEGDESSLEYATLMEWNNIYYQEKETLVNVQKTTIRLGLVQWQMRHFPSFESFIEQAEYFIDAVSDYQSDFVLFPELFNAPLMAPYNNLSTASAIRKLAEYTQPLRDKFSELAMSYNVNIITGSMPEVQEDGQLLNVGYLVRRDGTSEKYEKMHITPSEKSSWGMTGGNSLKVFDTDCGKIGVLICYDVEFPELSRLMADQGMQILFVPFLTDTQNGYMRVRRCAQARAIENECYVAIAGCVGNLPKVNNMDIQFAQAAVFTPCDFAFPTNGVKAEATPNTEMTLIADVDINPLLELHNFGSVRNLKDRRKDFFNLSIKNQE